MCNLPLTNPSTSNTSSLDPLTSPCSAGQTDNPPSPQGGGGGSGASVPLGKGSGAGTAKSKLGSITIPHLTGAPIGTQNPLNSLGATLANLFGAPLTTALAKKDATNTAKVGVASVSNTGFILMIVVVGGLMLFLAFGRKA